MNIRKCEIVSISAVTFVVLVCIGLVYLRQFFVENKRENCRYFASGVVTALSNPPEQLSSATAATIGNHPNRLSVLMLKGKLEGATTHEAYAKAYGACMAIN